MISTTQRRHRLGCPSGFTLTELLIALGLTLLLVSLIFAAIRLQVRTTSAGEKAVLKAQITRALVRQIQADISGVVFTEPEPEEPVIEDDGLTLGGDETGLDTDTSTETTSTTETDSESTTSNDPASALVNNASGLVGDAQQLVLHVSRPLHPLRLATTQTVAADSLISDDKSISWFLSGTSGPGGTSGQPGLARMEGDRFAMAFSENSGSSEQFEELTKVLAPEVEELAFRYFDGTNWVSDWDSTTIGRLPQAVEIKFGLMLEDPANAKIIMGTRVRPELEYVTQVIRIPRVEPYVENLGL